MGDEEWPKEHTQSLVIPLPKKRNLKKCQNYRTVSLISHRCKIKLRIMLNRLVDEAEEQLLEKQAGFTPGWCTVEQISNGRFIIKKHMLHQCGLLHNFTDFKKAFDRV